MSDAQKKLEAIKRLIFADLEATSDEELRKEMIEDGECPEKVAEGMRVSLETLIQKFQPARGADGTSDIQQEKAMEKLNLPAGTIIKVNGTPFRLATETVVEGLAANLPVTAVTAKRDEDAAGVDASEQSITKGGA